MNNRPIPIKLLPAGANRTQLLKDIGERSVNFQQNDYIEKLAGQKAKEGKPRHAAISLLAIENASEIAKGYLHAKGLFEQIMKDIIGTRGYISYQIKTTKNNLNIQRKQYPQNHHENFILIDQTFGNGSGHYGLIHLQHQNGKVRIYDSMYGAGGSAFEKVAQKWTKTNGNRLPLMTTKTWQQPSVRSIFGCKAKVRNLQDGGVDVIQVQPSGGFVSTNYTNFLNENYNGAGRNGFGKQIERLYGKVVAKGAFRLSQYDELSQHHFCYMESIYAMMLAIGLTKNPGPNDPRKRISFIKKFVWGMIHKYTPKSQRRTAKWKYFSKTFPYIMTTESKTGKPLKLYRGNVLLPDRDGTFKTKTLKASWSGYDKIDPSWSLTDVLNWVHTGRSPRGNRNANSNSNSNSNNNNSNSNSNSNNYSFVQMRRPKPQDRRGNPNFSSNNNSNSNNNNNRRSNSNSNSNSNNSNSNSNSNRRRN